MKKINEQELLIMVYDKQKEIWIDNTNKIVWYSEDEMSVRVRYYNNSKFYYKSYNDIEIVNVEDEYNVDEDIYVNGHTLSNYNKILIFDSWVKVFYNNQTTKVFLASQISSFKELYNKGPNSILRFNYYKELAGELSTHENEFLANMYDSLNISNKDTILTKFLSKRPVNKLMPIKEYIFPFGLNLSQKEAVENAFNNDLSVIEGPPGTGKTQTILNIISNAIYHNKTVAVVSNNNAAIENVQSKLKEYNLDFLTALLGNKQNKTQFFENEINKAKPLLYLESRELNKSDNKLLELIHKYKDELPKLYQAENNLAVLKEKYNSYSIELNYFNKDNKVSDSDTTLMLRKKLKNSKQILHLKAVLEHNDNFSWIRKIHFIFKNKISFKSLTSNDTNNTLTFLELHYYKFKLLEIEKEITKIKRYLKKEGFNKAKESYENISKEALKRKLYKKYSSFKSSKYTYNNYRNNFSEFTYEYPIVLSTSYSLIPSAKKGFVFDYLIIDEASQTDLLSSVLAMSCAKKMVVVGDTKQLPQIENQSLFNVNQELKTHYKISPEYDYFNNNILTSILKIYEDIPKVLLKEHYRCHPKIIGFCNQKFYNNELIILTQVKSDIEPLKLHITVPGNHARKNPSGSGWYNQREIDEIKQIVNEISEDNVGVITPYNYQAKLILDSLNGYSSNIEVDTVHSFQGRAKDIVILSTVANDLTYHKDNEFKEDFVARSDLLNVAVSRAKSQLNLLVSDKLFNSKNNSISDLIKYIRYNSSSDNIKKGDIHSIFDLLYSDYQEELDNFRSKNNSKEYDSEKLAFQLIDRILSESKISTLKVITHYPLKLLIKNRQGLLKHEVNFVNHNWSHVDFLIVNTLTKEFVLVIEVDGVSFHEQNIKQSERDKIKDKALEINKLPILRLKTNESNEENRIKEALKKALNQNI